MSWKPMRNLVALLGVAILTGCGVGNRPPLISSEAENSFARAEIARKLEASWYFSSSSTVATALLGGLPGTGKSPIADAMISGPNQTSLDSRVAFFCIDVTFAGEGIDNFARHARAEFHVLPDGRMSPGVTKLTNERCTGTVPPRRFTEMVELRRAALQRQ